MKAVSLGSFYEVSVTPEDVQTFASTWPCSGLDTNAEYVFTFSSTNGDLVDLVAVRGDGSRDSTERDDGAALLALSEDACAEGARSLGLGHVLDIRGYEASVTPPMP